MHSWAGLQGTEWNVQIIQAPQVWEIGSDGAGVVVMGKFIVQHFGHPFTGQGFILRLNLA